MSTTSATPSSKHDPANAETYKANAEAYKAKIKATIDPIRAELGHPRESAAGW